MKFSGQTNDGTIDNLLRAYVSRPSNPHQVCPGFDPDQANAYIERRLPSTVRMQYETHLSGCAPCRKGVVALMRMADAELPADLRPTAQVPRSTWISGMKRIFCALSQPQWAMAAAAVIVLSVSLPLFLSRNQVRDTSPAVASQATPEGLATPAPPASPAASPRSGETPALAAAQKRENGDDKAEALAKNAPAPASPEAASVIAAADEISKKSDVQTSAEPVGEAQRKSEGQVAAAPVAAGAGPASQVARSDADNMRQQQPEKDLAQQATASKVAARGNEEGAKEKTERAEDVAAPPPPEVARGRSGFRRTGKLALRDPNTTEAVRPEERKFSGKKFLFKEGAWTDKDFDPNKDLPVVTIIRDSNVYKEVLSKRPGLKPFLTGFLATERAIIVYKGTVYKLIPQ